MFQPWHCKYGWCVYNHNGFLRFPLCERAMRLFAVQASGLLAVCAAVALLARLSTAPASGSVELFAHGSVHRSKRCSPGENCGPGGRPKPPPKALRGQQQMLSQQAPHAALMKCMHLAKKFKGTHPGSHKVLQAEKSEALTCLALVKGEGNKGPSAKAARSGMQHTAAYKWLPTKAARSGMQHSAAYLFREVPETKTLARTAQKAKRAVPKWVQKLPAWDDKQQDALDQHKLSATQVARGVAEWEGIGQAHVRPPSRGRSTRE
jgi:hypothetical protein